MTKKLKVETSADRPGSAYIALDGARPGRVQFRILPYGQQVTQEPPDRIRYVQRAQAATLD